MAGGMRIRLGVTGFRELRRALVDNPIYAEPVNRVLTRHGEELSRQITQRAPGRLGQRVELLIDPRRPVIRWAKVRIRFDSRKNRFRYPWALSASKKVKYHYRGTPKLTFGWLNDAVDKVKTALVHDLNSLSADIRRRWNK